eukprot:6302360-Pyramimonas_sp.AAC.1
MAKGAKMGAKGLNKKQRRGRECADERALGLCAREGVAREAGKRVRVIKLSYGDQLTYESGVWNALRSKRPSSRPAAC